MQDMLPVSPGAIIGYRRTGTPIRLIAGGSGEGEEGNSSTEGQGDGGNGDAGQQGGSDGESGTGDRDNTGTGRDGQGRFTGRDDDEHTARTVAAIREDFKTERSKRQAAEKELASVKAAQQQLQQVLEADKADRAKQMDAFAVALGLKSGDEPPDPVKLAADLKAAQETAQAEISRRDSALRERTVELAVLRSAGKHGANGDALLDSRSFMAKVNGLDPSADGFANDLAEAIKDAVENGPQYKTPAASGNGSGAGSGQNGSGERKPPARSGGEHTAPGGQRQWTREEAAAVAKSDPRALQKAINDGLLTGLGYYPSAKH